MEEAKKKHDVALSYASEQGAYVEEVTRGLTEKGVSHFFDRHERAETWGEDLAVHFDEIFRKRARFVVVFVSQDYARKTWPRLEFRSALAKAVESVAPYILPVRFDETELPGLRSTIGYVDAHERGPQGVVELILRKLGKGDPNVRPAIAGEGSPKTEVALPRIPPANFNPFAEAERLFALLCRELATRSERLSELGFVSHATTRDGRFKLRLLRNGKLTFVLDAWLGRNGFGGDDRISFYHGSREASSPGTMTASAAVEWDRKRNQVVVKLFNFSLLPSMAAEYTMTTADFVDAIWKTIVEHLESM